MKIDKFQIEESINTPVSINKNDLGNILDVLKANGFKSINFVYNEYNFDFTEIEEFKKLSKKNTINELIIEAYRNKNDEEPEIIIDIDLFDVLMLANNDTIINRGIISKIHHILNLKKRFLIMEIFVLVLSLLSFITVLIINPLRSTSLSSLNTVIALFVTSFILPSVALRILPKLQAFQSNIILSDEKNKPKISLKYKNELILAVIANLLSIAIINVIAVIIKILSKIF